MTFGILQQLNFCSENRFTGKLCVISVDSKNTHDFGVDRWIIYFYRGRLVGDSHGIHPVRRWRRQFLQQQIDLPVDVASVFFVSDRLADRNHLALNKLLAGNYIEREQAEKIIEGSLIEILFDIIYCEAVTVTCNEEPLTYILQADKEDNTSVPSVLIKSDLLLEKVNASFQIWREQNFMSYSPNYTPHIYDYTALQKVVPAKTYAKVVELINGKRTLRDIAVETEEDVELIVVNIIKYYQLQVLSLQAMPDIAPNELKPAEQKLAKAITNDSRSEILGNILVPSKKKLVAHLGDNDAEVKTIESIVKNAGHEYINLQESAQALMTFLKYQPDLILVDSLATKINAYDLCSQLRRTSKFKDTPIVFLSGSEGMMNRIRNKISYSADYITKPLSHQKIFTVLDKYVNVSDRNDE